MKLEKIIADLKASGANQNTIRLAKNCYELGHQSTLEEMVYAHPTTAIKKAVAIEREACAYEADEQGCHMVAAAIRARGPN